MPSVPNERRMSVRVTNSTGAPRASPMAPPRRQPRKRWRVWTVILDKSMPFRLCAPDEPREVKARELHVLRGHASGLFAQKGRKCLRIQDPNRLLRSTCLLYEPARKDDDRPNQELL